jgi:hypothetical protein
MPKDSSTGKLLLAGVKREQKERLAARTALAIERCQSSSEVLSKDIGEAKNKESSVSKSEGPWTRHDFERGNLLVFARGDNEAITIRKDPEGPGWIIDFGGSVEYRPE